MPRSTQASGSTNEPARSLTWSGSGSSGVRDVLARGGGQLAEPAGLERAGDERGAERLVARLAARAGAARDVVGERDAQAGRERSVDHDARDLVAQHRAGGRAAGRAASRRRCRTARRRARARGRRQEARWGRGARAVRATLRA